MTETIRTPKMNDPTEEGVFVRWLQKEGDAIQLGEILAEAETDSAFIALENYENGILLPTAAKDEKAAVNALSSCQP